MGLPNLFAVAFLFLILGLISGLMFKPFKVNPKLTHHFLIVLSDTSYSLASLEYDFNL